jgi:predicted PurR-regulated permease PerM
MSQLPPIAPVPRSTGLELNPWLQRFLTIIAGTVVAVIAWTVIERFLHILVLLLASFLVAFLLGPLVDRLEGRGVPRLLAILLLYLTILGALTGGALLLIGPLTTQVQGLSTTLPTLLSSESDAQTQIDQFLRQIGLPVSVAALRDQLAGNLTSAGSSLLGGTLTALTGLVGLVTDLFLVLAITFYLLLDGNNMHTWALRLLPTALRERWFFIEATLNRVLGGYIRGQIIVSLTVGIAAGLGSALLGVHYPLVIGLLAFLFEFIPMVGPILGMVPAVLLALFQPLPLVVWVIVYFIVLQQVESNVIVPRVSGQAVGLHPLGVLLALLAGVELGGLGGALLAVPLAGVLYVIFLALYSDAAGQTSLLRSEPRPNAYSALRQALGPRRGGHPPAAPVSPPAAVAVPLDRLTTIAKEQAALSTQFAAQEAAHEATPPGAAPAAPAASAPPDPPA